MADLKDKYVYQTYHSILSLGTSGTSGLSTSSQRITDGDGVQTPISVSTTKVSIVLSNYASDAEAETGGVPVNGLYHTNGTVKVRLS